MCMFCAAIPIAAATGASFNARQRKRRRSTAETPAQASSPAGHETVELPHTSPIMRITGGVIALLMVGSLTYHTLTRLPY